MGLLLSLVSGLGSVKQLADGSAAYVADEQCLDCLYDIQRFLRRDEPATRDVVCQLSDWNALRQHFVPLLVTYASKFDVAFNATKARARVCVCVSAGGPPACCAAKTPVSVERRELETLLRGATRAPPDARRPFTAAPPQHQVCVFMTQPCDPDTKNPGDQLRALQRAKATLLESSSVLTAVTNLLAEPLSRCVTPLTRGLPVCSVET